MKKKKGKKACLPENGGVCLFSVQWSHILVPSFSFSLFRMSWEEKCVSWEEAERKEVDYPGRGRKGEAEPC